MLLSSESTLKRSVKGILFADYVRMIRTFKPVDWSRHLEPEDLVYLQERIDPAAWYPMETFERLGNAILNEIANNDMQAVRMWGRFSVDAMRAANAALVADGDPIDTLMRFRVLRATYFDFDALDVLMLIDGQAQIEIHYQMGNPAEEAASYQTLGFFERLLEVAGATEVAGQFLSRSWAGDARTVLDLAWQQR
jgi:hypothetical protein